MSINEGRALEGLIEKIGWEFRDRDLLITALTHASLINERAINKTEDYERQEFLGDAVLELVVSDHLFRTRKELDEGDMTKLRASLVCEPTLALCAKAIDLSEYIRLGKGEEKIGSRYRDSIVSDVFEAVIGALYLDGGLDAAKTFIHRYVLDDYEEKALFTDSKSNLQKLVQQTGKELVYELISETGPDHAKEYEIAALINGRELGRGRGRSKKSAEQHAAYAVLKNPDFSGNRR